MLDSVEHMTSTLLKSHIFGVKKFKILSSVIIGITINH